jgi:hypothetical protein
VSAVSRWLQTRSLGAIIFDLIVVGFVGLIVFNALQIRPGAALVPLLIGIPTLVFGLIILVLDLFPRLRRATGDDGKRAHGLSAIRAAEEEDDVELPTDPALRRRQAAFAAWVVGFVLLAAFTNIYIAVPVALTVIFLAIRLPLIQIVAIVAVTVIGMYALFHQLLGLRL